ncbi:MAG: zinc ribbon domain-containing protein [Solirubrobacteraceae bacterium]
MAGFDGSLYRREVLTQLRERNPAEIEDLFWLAHVPRELDDSVAIVARLKDTRGFLNKERSRQRQAAVATAVLKEWPRVEEVLTTASSRRALRARLLDGPQHDTGSAPVTRRRQVRTEDPLARRRRQVTGNLAELARLRAEPDLASDLFAFLGLPTSATRPMIEQRLVKVGEVNRRRRPDRERTLVDELLVQARELLVDGEPTAYVSSFADDIRDAVIDALLAGDAAIASATHHRAEQQHVSDSAILAGLREPASRSSTVVPVSALGLGTWCAVCGGISAADAHACPSCAAALTLACPQCRTISAVDGVACPSCSEPLQAARAPLLARREDYRAEQGALVQVDAAPEDQRQELLSRLAVQHPQWQRVRQRMDSAPPRAPEHVSVSFLHGEARLAWPSSSEPGVDGYLVERHDAGGSRVLGRTGMTAWSDAQGSGEEVRWSVRALRGDAAVSPATTAVPAGLAPPVTGALTDVHALAGAPVELVWIAPAGARVVVERIEHRLGGDVRRQLSVDPGGYRDRHVARGRSYEYRISLAGGSAPPVVLSLTAGSGTRVQPAGPASQSSARSARRRPAPAATPHRPLDQRPSVAEPPAVVIDQVAADREDDVRVRVTWRWPAGITEAYVAFDQSPPAAASAPGRKITNMRYELDGGALLDDIPSGTHLAVFAGRRDASGVLQWGHAQPGSRAVAP